MGNNTPKKNRNAQANADQSLIDGLNKNSGTIPWVLLGGVAVPTSDLVTMLQTRIDVARTAQATQAAWLAAVQADEEEHAKTKADVSALKQVILAAFVGQVDKLAEFGLTGRKERFVAPEAKLAAAAKAKATRAARHTMGKRQKASVKGMVAPVAAGTPAESREGVCVRVFVSGPCGRAGGRGIRRGRPPSRTPSRAPSDAVPASDREAHAGSGHTGSRGGGPH